MAGSSDSWKGFTERLTEELSVGGYKGLDNNASNTTNEVKNHANRDYPKVIVPAYRGTMGTNFRNRKYKPMITTDHRTIFPKRHWFLQEDSLLVPEAMKAHLNCKLAWRATTRNTDEVHGVLSTVPSTHPTTEPEVVKVEAQRW